MLKRATIASSAVNSSFRGYRRSFHSSIQSRGAINTKVDFLTKTLKANKEEKAKTLEKEQQKIQNSPSPVHKTPPSQTHTKIRNPLKEESQEEQK